MDRQTRFRSFIKDIYRFLPIQLVLMHFRKYQMLLVFWLVLVTTITGNFATTFGASTLFLTPEYLGETNFFSMLLLGGAMAVFVMTWHITTFIIHSHRVPFMGATRHAFLKYCINNSIIPLVFLIFYSIVSIRFQWFNEHADVTRVIRFQLSFYVGFMLIIIISFAYFFRVDRDLLKVVLSKITNPARIREIIPYDSLDYEVDIIRADTYLSGRFKVKKCSELEPYHPRFLNTVLRMHHRNAITATIFAILLLLLSGIFMDDPRLRIPAGAGFLILFSIIMAMVSAMKYFLRSWEILGWLIILFFIGWLVARGIFDLRSIAIGIKYGQPTEQKPVYDYDALKKLFTPERYEQDKKTEEARLSQWLANRANSGGKTPMVIVVVSGGGSRSAYWTFKSLQHIDSSTGGALFRNTVLITGASGGMVGASYWRELHSQYAEGKITNPYAQKYQDNIGKDLLNAIIFSFASIDLLSPFNKINIRGNTYYKDRGYAMESELIRNTEGLLNKTLGDYAERERKGQIPAMIINSTIINDGRKLMMGNLPLGYLTQPAYSMKDTATPAIDAVDFAALFKNQDPYNLSITSAIRMNATFPYILPPVKLPSRPQINIMDAGLRDNFGIELAARYLFVMKDWMKENAGDVILLQIRDTREHDVFRFNEMNSLSKMIGDPLFVIQNKWQPFQSYTHGYLKDVLPSFLDSQLRTVTMQYIPEEKESAAALNFHLTTKEKADISKSIRNKENVQAIDTMKRILNATK